MSDSKYNCEINATNYKCIRMALFVTSIALYVQTNKQEHAASTKPFSSIITIILIIQFISMCVLFN